MLLCAKYTSYHRRRSVAACFFVQSICHIIDGGVLQRASLCKVYVISLTAECCSVLLCAKYMSYHRRRSVAACFFVQSICHIIDGGVLQRASLCKVYVIS